MSDPETHAAKSAAADPSIAITIFDPDGCDEIFSLHASVFGPGRFAKTAFRLRETAAPLKGHCYQATSNETLIGAVTLSAISVGGTPLALLGPLAVFKTYREKGIGRALLQRATQSAFSDGLPAVLLVGDAAYYAPFGYEQVPLGSLSLPGPVDPARLLIAYNRGVRAGSLSGVALGVGR